VNIAQLELQKVDETKPVPLYYQVTELLEELIKEGKIKPGTKLPPEESLAAHFGVSRPTINKALGLLIRKSLVYRDRGKGTFVSEKKEVKLTLIRELVSFGEALEKEGVSFNTEVLALRKIQANKLIAEKLGTQERENVVYLKRLRNVDNEPLLIVESYLPYNLFPGLLEKDFSKDFLYQLLEEKYHTRVVRADRSVRAVKALEKDAYILKVPVGDPLIKMNGVALSPNNTKVEYFDLRMRGDRGVLYTTLYRRDTVS